MNQPQTNLSRQSPLFAVQNLSFRYRLGAVWVEALKNVNFEVQDRAFITLSGPSGSGKSTLLNLLGLIEPIQTGDIFFQTNSLKNLSEKEKNRLRRFSLGFIFQNFNLIEVLTAEENIAYFLDSQGLKAEEKSLRIENSLRAVGLLDHRNKKPLEMSGGQRQRVAIARALAKHPRVILADEPTASLDQQTGREIMKVLLELNQCQGVSLIIASHDPMVLDLSPEKIRLRDGEIL
jgi:ABC-type lipoprotein export system ATPase subunit